MEAAGSRSQEEYEVHNRHDARNHSSLNSQCNQLLDQRIGDARWYCAIFRLKELKGVCVSRDEGRRPRRQRNEQSKACKPLLLYQRQRCLRARPVRSVRTQAGVALETYGGIWFEINQILQAKDMSLSEACWWRE